MPPASGRAAVGHPIDVASGTLFMEIRDAAVSGRLSLVFQRRYTSSGIPRDGMLGPGWWTPFEVKLCKDLEGYRLLAEDGESEIPFLDLAGAVERGGVVRNLGAFAEIFSLGDKLVVRRWSEDGLDVSRLVFEQPRYGQWAHLVESVSEDGDGFVVRRDSNGRIARLEQKRERRGFELVHGRSGRLVELKMFSPSETRTCAQFGYDQRGRLCEVTDAAGNRARYDYDEQGRMVQETTRTGARWGFTFDENGRCVRAVGEGGFDEKRLEYKLAEHQTRVTNSRGAVTMYDWNDAGQVVRVTSPKGRVRVSVFDDLGRLAVDGHPGGRAHKMIYDENGNVATREDPAGAKVAFEHLPSHQIAAFVDKGKQRRAFEYDELGRLVAKVNALGKIQRFERDHRGDVVRVTNPEGGRQVFFWDDEGNLTTQTDTMGETWRHQYGPFGERTATTDPLGGVRRWEYDVRGNVVEARRRDGSIVRNEYDAGGRLVKSIDPEGNVRQYGVAGCSPQVVSRGVPPATAWLYGWDREPGQLLSVRNPRGETWQFEYDEDNLLAKETTFDGRTFTFTYDERADLVERRCADAAVKFKYDDAGRPTSAVYEDGSAVELAYDEAGRLIETKDPAGSIKFERDAFGRTIKESWNDFEVERAYDDVGRVAARKTSLGEDVRFQFDPNGRVVGVNTAGQQVSIRRDAIGHERERVLPGGGRVATSFDGAGNLATQEVRRAPVATDTWAPATQAADLTVKRAWTHDLAGRVTGLDDARWGQARYRYDGGGNLVSAFEAPSSSETRIQRDQAGRITAVRVAHQDRPTEALRDHEVASDAGRGAKLLDAHERGVDRDLAPGGRTLRQGSIRYEFDARGRLTHMLEGGGGPQPASWRYQWDARDRLAAVERPDGGVWRYRYDACDRRVAKISPTGAEERYFWESERLTHTVSAEGDVTTWTYFSSLPVPFAKREQGKTLFAITDATGTAHELVEGDGAVAWSGWISPFGAVTVAPESTTQCPTAFPGQWRDRESGLSYNRFRYYAPWLAQYITPDPLRLFGAEGVYGYPTSPFTDTDPSGLTAQVQYDPYDTANDRPGSALARVTPADLGPANGTPATAPDPRGYNPSCPDHHEKGHLIAQQLGGDGSHPENIVLLTSGSNHPVMKNVETDIRKAIDAAQKPALVMVEPVYHGDENVPIGLRITAQFEDGSPVLDRHGQPIDGVEVLNGEHKKTYNGVACSH